MHALFNVVSLAILAVAVVMAVHVAVQYKTEAVLTGWARVWATARDSATYFFGKLGILLSAISLNLDKIADALGEPQLTGALNQIGANPKTIGTVLLVASLATIAARLRTLQT